MTGRTLIKASLRLLGVLASGEAPTADEASEALTALNALISSWSTESLIVPSRVRETFTLTNGDADYTMGTSGDFNTTRPLLIEAAAISQNSAETPIAILSLAEWASIAQKSTQGVPVDLWPQPGSPLWTINLHPVPSSALTLVLYSMKALTSWTTLDTDVSLLDGYERALKYHLALELAPEYGKIVPDAVAITATEAKSLIERINSKSIDLTVDNALKSNVGGFNINSGGYT